MSHAQQHIDLIAKLHLESWFSAHLSPAAQCTSDGKRKSSQMGLGTSIVTAGKNGPKTARAARLAATIA